MININNVKPLDFYLNYLSNCIKSIPIEYSRSKGFIPTKCVQYIKNIQSDIEYRSSCFNFYKTFIYNKNSFLKMANSYFAEDKSLNRMSIPSKIDNYFSYSDIRHQMLISLLCSNTRMYERSISLCHFLDKPEPDSDSRIVHSSEILKMDKKSRNFNKNTDEKYSQLLDALKRKFGHCFGTIVYLRNSLVHKGELWKSGDSLFMSDDEQDYLKKEFIEETMNEIIELYKLSHINSLKFFKESYNKNLYTIMDKCMVMSDHYIGYMIYSIFNDHYVNNNYYETINLKN